MPLVPDVLRAAARAPFTLLLALGMTAAGVATGAPVHGVDPALLDRWSFGVDALVQGRLDRYVTALLLTRGPWMFWRLLAFALLSVGAYELLAGTRRTLRVFWLGEAAGLLGLATCGVLLSALGAPVGRALLTTHDVGMSGGGFACLGALVSRVPGRARVVAVVAVFLFLLVRLVLLRQLGSEVTHLVTFPLGLWLDARSRRSPGLRPQRG